MPDKKERNDSPAKPKRPMGRPRLGLEPYTVNLQVRVTAKTAEAAKKLGGASFLRPLIEKATGRALPVNDTPASVAGPAFRPVFEEAPVTFVDMGAQCGFPSPAFDYATQELSLNDYFFRHPDATYIVEARGDSMVDAGIQEGDILMIDRSLEARSGDIVLAVVNGEFTVKRLVIENGVTELRPENAAAGYPAIRPQEFDDFQIEGVLVGSGRKYRG